MRRPAHQLLKQTGGNAAAEMALVAPLVVLLIFGAMELGNLFYNQHLLSKAVRDGARYAARQPFSVYDMSACSISSDAEARTRRLVRTAQLASAGAPSRLPNWRESDEPSTIDINVTCNTSGTYTGVYVQNDDVAAAVTVEASVTYTPLIGISAALSDVTLTAQSQAAVTGI